jgi:hypothetical protein
LVPADWLQVFELVVEIEKPQRFLEKVMHSGFLTSLFGVRFDRSS